MMLQSLPVELTLKAMAYLTIQQLFQLQLVSSYWKAFFAANESSIYRNVAALHNFVSSPDISLPDAISTYPERSMVYVAGWREFCTWQPS